MTEPHDVPGDEYTPHGESVSISAAEQELLSERDKERRDELEQHLGQEYAEKLLRQREREFEDIVVERLRQSGRFDSIIKSKFDRSENTKLVSANRYTPNLVLQCDGLFIGLDISVLHERNLHEVAVRRGVQAERIRQQLPDGSLLVLLIADDRDPLHEYDMDYEDEHVLTELKSVAQRVISRKGFDAVIQVGSDVQHVRVASRTMRLPMRTLSDALIQLVEDTLLPNSDVGPQDQVFDENLRPASDAPKAILKDRRESFAPSPSFNKREKYLLVADEWSPAKGGISSFNIELAKALRIMSRDVCVALPFPPSEAEQNEARALGIKLAVPSTLIPGITGPAALLSGIEYLDSSRYRPTVIIGHGRVLGPYAYAVQRQYPTALRIHIVHMHAEELERAKESDTGEPRTRTAAEKTALEVELASSSDIVAGVGEKLTHWISDQVHANPLFKEKGGKVVCLMPGLRSWSNQSSPRVPSEKNFLVTARADDFESKGIAVAIRAVGEARLQRPNYSGTVNLVIRGVPEEHSELKQRIDAVARPYGSPLPTLREFTASPSDIERDLRTAVAVLMPSKTEGFGLSAYEAIAAAIPVVVTQESGLARLLREVEHNPGWPDEVLPPEDEAAWVEAILRILDDPEASFYRAKKLKDTIIDKDYWTSSVINLEKALADVRAAKMKSVVRQN